MKSVNIRILRLVIALFAVCTASAELQPGHDDDENDVHSISRVLYKVKMHSNRGKRIIGGQEIQNGQYPWLVNVRGHIPTKMISLFAVQYYDIYCAGSVISKRWIVTAAHCFAVPGISTSSLLNVKNWYIKAGDVKLSFSFGQRLCAIWNRLRRVSDIHCWYIGVENIIIHPQYNEQDSWINDIALIKLSSDLPLAPTDTSVNVVQLPTAYSGQSWPAAGTSCAVQGWGCTAYGGGMQYTARSVAMPVVNDVACINLVQPSVGPTRLCAGYTNDNIGLCKGDSGGGLVCKDSASGKWILAGIASFTSLTTPGAVPGVFTRVSAYIDWIRNITTTN